MTATAARYERFEKARVQAIDAYNELAAEPLARRVIVVDEFQDLIADRATRQAFLDSTSSCRRAPRARWC